MKTQRAIPFNQTYTLVETFYSALENGNACENCGKPITNIAKIKGDTDGITRHVGMDCAATLQGIKENFNFDFVAKQAFQAAKSARAALLKMKKKADVKGVQLIVKVQTFKDGEGFYKEEGSGWYITDTEPFHADLRTWKQFPAIYWEKHVRPMIKDLATLTA